MKRNYLIILIIVILIALVTFFYPRECGYWGTAVSPNAIYKDCTCIGIKYSPALIGGADVTCFGIPTSSSCYFYESGEGETVKVDIPCDK